MYELVSVLLYPYFASIPLLKLFLSCVRTSAPPRQCVCLSHIQTEGYYITLLQISVCVSCQKCKRIQVPFLQFCPHESPNSLSPHAPSPNPLCSIASQASCYLGCCCTCLYYNSILGVMFHGTMQFLATPESGHQENCHRSILRDCRGHESYHCCWQWNLSVNLRLLVYGRLPQGMVLRHFWGTECRR